MSKCNYFLDDDGIDNVTLRIWKFSDFCSRHTVGIAGDDIMHHILVRSEWVKILTSEGIIIAVAFVWTFEYVISISRGALLLTWVNPNTRDIK